MNHFMTRRGKNQSKNALILKLLYFNNVHSVMVDFMALISSKTAGFCTDCDVTRLSSYECEVQRSLYALRERVT